jgi:hypothetical protein
VKTGLFVIGSLALTLPATLATAQVPTPVTPVAPQRTAVPTPRVGTITGGMRSGAPLGGGDDVGLNELKLGAGAQGGGGEVGYGGGGDFIMSDHNPALWGGVRHRKPVPRHHVVREGDTLWEICEKYYGDPWSWPQLWAYNKSITNPHWIYPGDRIRLLGAPTGPAEGSGSERIRVTRSRVTATGPVSFKQNAFVDQKELADAGSVHGAKAEKLLLSNRDEIYLEKDDQFRPQVGKSYAVYRVKKKLENSKGDDVGSVVEIRGTAKIKRTPKDKVPTAVITESVRPIERGDRIGPLRRRFKRLPVVRATRNQEAAIIGSLESKIHHATDDIVFVDLGTSQGVQEGNRFLVVRTGDARKRLMQDEDDPDEKWPREAVAEISVLDPREKVSVGLITRALKEVKVGDRVIMRKGY